MKFLSICTALCVLLGTHVWAGTCAKQGRKYVDEKSISVKKGRIIVKTKNGPKIAKALHTSKKGLYVLENELHNAIGKCGDEPTWDCTNGCGYSAYSPAAAERHEQTCEHVSK